MRCFAIISVCALALAAGAGCKKKKPAPAPAEPEAAPAIKADGLPNESPPPPAGGGANSGGIIPGAGVGVVVNPQAALGGGGGGGAVSAVRKAAVRTTDLNEMKTLGELIELMRDELGKMPTKERILTELRQQSPKLFTAISEGSIILTGTTEGGGLWAFSADADNQPGFAVIGGRATRTTPDQLRPYLLALPRPPQPAPPPQGQPQPMPRGGLDNRPAPAQPQTAPAAAARVTQQDLEEVRLFIDNRSGAAGRMPSPQETFAALKQAASPQTVTLVQTSAITLAPARTRDDVWAYETAALQRGGLVASANGVETMTADALRRRLGR